MGQKSQEWSVRFTWQQRLQWADWQQPGVAQPLSQCPDVPQNLFRRHVRPWMGTDGAGHRAWPPTNPAFPDLLPPPPSMPSFGVAHG